MEQIGFLSPTGKRHGDPDLGSALGSAKRVKTHQRSPLSVPTGHAVFRMLCPVSQVGSVIGKSGSVIKQLQQSTGSKIRVEEAPNECPYRVITVIAQVGSKSRVKLGVGEETDAEVSKAQEALIRVFEVLVFGEVGSGTVSCRLLAEASHASAVIGKGGKTVEKIRKETGCKVSVWTENLPACADPNEEMVEIEGTVLAVKKALLSVSCCLQDCQPINRTRTAGNRSIDSIFQETLHRPADSIVREALPRPVEVTSQDFRLGTVNMLSQGTLLRPIEVIPRDALHRPINLFPRDTLYRPTNIVSGDYFSMPREVDPHDALQRPVELVRHDALARPPLESFPRDALLRRVEAMPLESHPQLSAVYLSHRNSVLDTPPPRSSIASHSTFAKTPPPETKVRHQEVVFKILCSTDNAGGVIGKGGNIVRIIHIETGASINVGNTLPDCDERLIAVTASENPEDQNSPAQKAIILVLSRLFDLASRKGLDNGSTSSITARLVVPTDYIGCLLGKGGSIVSEMRKKTGTVIQVLKVEQNPKCVTEGDQVVQVSGEFPNVKDAVYHVTSRLRDNLFSNSMKNSATEGNVSIITERNSRGKSDDPVLMGSHPSFSHSLTMSTSLYGRYDDSRLSRSHPPVNYSKTIGTDPYIRPNDPFPDGFHPSAGYSPKFGRQSTMDHINGPHYIDQTPSHSWASQDGPHHMDQTPSHSWASQPVTAPRGLSDASGGLSSNRAGFVLSGGSKSAVVTNTTVEIRVPETAMKFVYGEGGQNLEQLRQISGARVIVHEPQQHIGTSESERIIVMSGTPHQTQAAQNLLHAFILTGESRKHLLPL
ncbi:PREDICTED: KH domain-containing protein HEN4 isoform X2 [Tarenaya hassleriana]|uniref:KH domain-containing protein HEN4 isoform X2 n=1 Tax=Tarenaya hassleriana TaxID=28532 RepID=UPI00053C1A04|nr:PREDICTED: KH domain-containing protein HEN4 isoform X2 [Tarenaya hassleriana]